MINRTVTPAELEAAPLVSRPAPVLLSVLIPAYNAEPLLAQTVQQTVEYLRGLGISFEVVIANDGSTDRTAAVLDELSAAFPEVHGLRLHRNRGKGAAVRAAFAAARGSRVIFMDADGATSLEAIPVFLAALEQKDVAIGSRPHPASHIPVPQPLYRKAMGLFMRHLVRGVTGLPQQDTQCGFKMFRREAAEAIVRRQLIDRFAFDVELCFLARRLDYTVVELPVPV